MTARAKRIGLVALAAATLIGGPLQAQDTDHSLGVSAHFQGISFADALGLDVANLLMIPIAYRLTVTQKFSAGMPQVSVR